MPPCASSVTGYQSIVNFFFGKGFLVADVALTAGAVSTTGAGSTTGVDAGSWKKSVNLLINPNRIL